MRLKSGGWVEQGWETYLLPFLEFAVDLDDVLLIAAD